MIFSLLQNQRTSKQAIAKHVNVQCVQFIRSALFAVISNLSKFDALSKINAFESFNRVLIQDSTIVSLPDHLASYFPGPTNQTRKKNA